MAQLSFDASQVAPAQALEPIKAGWYIAHITDSELCQTQSQDGHYLKLEFTILGDQNGEKSGNRKVFTNLNLHNKNETAVRITGTSVCDLPRYRAPAGE